MLILDFVRLIYMLPTMFDCYILFKSDTIDTLFKVLIDESTQATEPECLIPLVLGAKQVLVNLPMQCVLFDCCVSNNMLLFRLFLLVIIVSLVQLLCARKQHGLG